MHKWKEYIVAIESRLQELAAQLKPFLDKEKKTALDTQLQTIEQTINKLGKTGVVVPDELRDLKFRLLNDLDQFKEAAKAHKELEVVLLQFVQPQKANKKLRKNKRPKQKIRHTSAMRIELIQLIEAQILIPNTILYRKYKGDIFRAIITDEGQIELTLNDQTQYFNSPSGAARAVTGRPTDGWLWWLVESGNKILDEYRKKYLNDETRR